jgi:ATP-binding cassette subfamily B protein
MMDCGAAALATVALHYQRPIGLEQMRELTGTDRAGTNLFGLVQAAEHLGFSAKAVKGLYEALPQVPLPAIAHVRTEEGLGHFVVLHRLTKHGVIVADPAREVAQLSHEAFCRRWTGYLLILVPEHPVSPARQDGTPGSPWRRFVGLLRPHTPLLVEAFCCAFLMTVLGLSTAYFLQHLVDGVLARQEQRLLNALGIGMVLVLLFRTLFGLLRQYLLSHIGRQVNLGLIAGYAQHILTLPLRFFEMRRVGEILSRIHDAAKVREAISSTTTTTVVDSVLVLVFLVVLWLYDWRLALVATGFVPVLVVSVGLSHPATKRRSREAMEHAAQLSAHLVEDVAGVETIKAFGAERARVEEGEASLVGLVQSMFALQKLGMSINSLSLFVTALAGIVILWYGGFRVMDGALTIGQLMFFYSLLGYLLEPLQRLAAVNLTLQEALVAVDRLYQILDLEAEQCGPTRKLPFTGIRQAIELREVSFRYGYRANVLEHVTLRIPVGQTVAIVGESGSGKSTVLKLLLGFYTPTAGRILIDGVDMQDFALASLRSRMGFVAQSPFIFTGTVRENIALGRPDATLAEILEAARAAELDPFITSLPERYETVIGERGANLSGGQRQRLAIARALLRQPELLLFDEATSHLDTTTERAIQHSLTTALTGKTVVLVAHRLSTIKEADLIYVLHQGRIVQAGTHRELLAQEGRYRLLWRAQTDETEGSLHAGGTVASATARNGHRPASMAGVSYAG